MANKKFSEFTLKTDSANVDFLVGFDGSDNVRIAPSNLSSGGASSLNGLSDCAVDGTSVYVSNVPSGLSGSPANNTVFGESAGNSLTTSPDNVFIGHNAGVNFNNTGGDGRNTAIGSGAGNDLTSGIYNTLLGYQAGGQNTNITTGNFNVMVGYQAKASTGAASNQNSFGYAAASTGNNQVTLGNSSIGTLRCQVTSITALSDQRDKTDIDTLPYGLDFIDSLQPKQFVWDNRAETDGDGNEFFSSNKGKKDIGFIAQELQSVDDDYLNLVYDENPDKLEATYGRLIPVLVQAIKELKAEVELLKG